MHNLKKIIYWHAALLTFVFIGFFGHLSPARALEINALRFGEQASALRIVLDLSNPTDFRAMLASDPNRLTLDIPRLSTAALTGKTNLPPQITDIRLEPFKADYTRISFILKAPATIRTAFLMPAAGQKPNRLVIDLTPSTESAFQAATKRTHGTLNPDITITTPGKPNLPFATDTAGIRLSTTLPESPDIDPATTDTRPLIMLDPGHGGHDSGAVGHKLQEKHITLSVAKEVKKTLEATGRYRVALTRDSDKFVSLAERVRIARRAEADLFISIHADSVEHGGNSVQGASFYTLSAQASDAATANLAARENKSDTLSGVSIQHDDHDVKTILIDLAMRETLDGAKKIARNLVSSFRKAEIKTVPSPVRSAGFMVLHAPDIPSILVELGFLSNAAEAEKLSLPEYRTHLATTIASGVDAYFKGNLK